MYASQFSLHEPTAKEKLTDSKHDMKATEIPSTTPSNTVSDSLLSARFAIIRLARVSMDKGTWRGGRGKGIIMGVEGNAEIAVMQSRNNCRTVTLSHPGRCGTESSAESSACIGLRQSRALYNLILTPCNSVGRSTKEVVLVHDPLQFPTEASI